VENLAAASITGIRFVVFAHAPGVAPRFQPSSLAVGTVGQSDLLAVDLAPHQVATLDVGLLTPSEARERLRTPHIQVMCAVAEIGYADGRRWLMPPATMFGPQHAEIPRALIGRARSTGETVCRDEAGAEYSEGAAVSIRDEPLAFTRCESGAWRDYQPPGYAVAKPFVRMTFVIASGHRPELGVDPGQTARLEVGAARWGIRPTLDPGDYRRVRLEIDDLTVEPAVRVADVWTTVGAPPVNVPEAAFTVAVRATQTP
jgi:hypothetical protein